jgi:hypothetical protein
MGKQSPGAAAAYQVQDRIEYFTWTIKPGASVYSRSWEKRSDAIPFRIAYIS